MANFTLDFDKAYEGNAKIEDGTYEVVIDKVNEDATKTGSEYINFWFRIRNDIKQPSHNQVVFNKVWKANKGENAGRYNASMINTLAKNAQLQNGKSYGSLDELLTDFSGKPLQATVKNETSEYNGKTYENLNVKYTDKTAFPNVQHVTTGKKEADPAPSNGITVDDEDLPF